MGFFLPSPQYLKDMITALHYEYGDFGRHAKMTESDISPLTM